MKKEAKKSDIIYGWPLSKIGKDIFALKSISFALAIQQCNDGDGTGGTEEHIGSARTLEECVKFVKAICPRDRP